MVWKASVFDADSPILLCLTLYWRLRCIEFETLFIELQQHLLHMMMEGSYVTWKNIFDEMVGVITRSNTLDFYHLGEATAKYLHVPHFLELHFLFVEQMLRPYSMLEFDRAL